jgi:hypothetical protein
VECTCLWWHDAHAHAVWCSWCTLEWPGYPLDELVTSGAIIGRERICVASRSLTTKIPSVLLVAVMWLQHTWCPRFRRGTFGNGITTSPIKRGRVWVQSFPCECTLVHPKFPNAYAMQCMLNGTFILIQKVVSKTKKNKFRSEGSFGSWLARNFWTSLRFTTQLWFVHN